MMMPQNKMRVFVILVVVSVLFACHNQKHAQEANSKIAKAKQQTNGTVPPQNYNDFAPPKSEVYNTLNGRSPFSSVTNSNDKNAEGNPLLGYSIGTLRLVGIVVEQNQNVAYVMAEDSKVYPVKAGDAIGDRGGKVIGVYSDRLDIAEIDSEENPPSQHIVTLQLKDASK